MFLTSIPIKMQSAIPTAKLQPHPPKKLLLLVILVIGALTLAGFLMIIKSHQTEPPPREIPVAQPVSQVLPPMRIYPA